MFGRPAHRGNCFRYICCLMASSTNVEEVVTCLLDGDFHQLSSSFEDHVSSHLSRPIFTREIHAQGSIVAFLRVPTLETAVEESEGRPKLTILSRLYNCEFHFSSLTRTVEVYLALRLLCLFT